MSARGGTASKQPCHSAFSALAFVGAFFVMLIGVADVSAQSRGRDGWDARFDERDSRETARRKQADMERQRKEQERAQQQQQQMQREAANATRAAQQDAGRDRKDWGGNQWQSASGQPDQNTNLPDRQDRSRATQGKNNADASGGKQASKDGNADADDANDWMLTDTERRVRELDRERRRDFAEAEKQNEILRQKEQARSDRIREHTLRQRQQVAENVTRLPPPAKEPSTRARPMPVSIDKDEPVKAVSERTSGLLDGVQSQASHLGMGQEALPVSDRVEDRDAGGVSKDAEKGESPKADPVAPKVTRSPPPAQSDVPTVYVEERGDELVVTEISPEDVEKAKALGFTVSDPVELKGAGSKVRRLSSPGKLRDEAERELHKALPFLPVTPNFSYTIFMGTIGEREAAAPDESKSSPASAEPCPQSTCFGSQLIRWSSELSSCAKNVKIGIIDTSFDISHPAFKTLNAIQADFLSGEQPSPYDWHGTAVLSLLAGDPHSGTPGLVPDATFLLATAFRSDANGNASTDTVRLLAALDWLDQLEVDVVNMSFSGPKDPALAKAIARMSKKGVVFIAAAGNMGPTAPPSYPAAYPHVVAVTAVNRKGLSYKSANRGSYVDVAAPGVDILTALPHAKQGLRTGTSFAVPFVTAIVAARAKDPTIRISQAANDLEQFSTRDLGPPGLDPIYGAGLALAPPQCREGGGIVARATVPGALDADDTPVLQPWAAATTTTFMNAGAGSAP